ncbi:hypothetical protein ACK3TF_001846 [Chlorella vulgaris]
MTLTPQGPHVIHGAVYGAAIAAGAGWISRRLTAAQSSSKPLESTVSLADYTAEVVNAWRHEAEAKRLKEELATSQAQLAKVSAELAALRPEADDQELAGLTVDTQVQAVSASPPQIDSRSKRDSDTEDLPAAGSAERAPASTSAVSLRRSASRGAATAISEELTADGRGVTAAASVPAALIERAPPPQPPQPAPVTLADYRDVVRRNLELETRKKQLQAECDAAEARAAQRKAEIARLQQATAMHNATLEQVKAEWEEVREELAAARLELAARKAP